MSISIETHNHLMRIAAVAVVSGILWLGIGLLSARFNLRNVIGGALLTGLFLYVIATADAEKRARQVDEGSEDIP